MSLPLSDSVCQHHIEIPVKEKIRDIFRLGPVMDLFRLPPIESFTTKWTYKCKPST